MKYQDIQQMTDTELETRIEEVRDELRVARFDMATKEVENTRSKRSVRRDLARLLTAHSERKKKF